METSQVLFATLGALVMILIGAVGFGLRRILDSVDNSSGLISELDKSFARMQIAVENQHNDINRSLTLINDELKRLDLAVELVRRRVHIHQSKFGAVFHLMAEKNVEVPKSFWDFKDHEGK